MINESEQHISSTGRNFSYRGGDANKLSQPEPMPAQKLKTSLGLVFITLGLAGGAWLAQQIWLLIQFPQKIPLVRVFTELGKEARTVDLPLGGIEIPGLVSMALGVLMYVLALRLALSLVHLLVSSGINLLENQIKTILQQIRRELIKRNQQDTLPRAR